MGNKVRNSSLELLRIISMFMVIAFHWEIHGFGDGIRQTDLSVNQVISFSFGSWGSLGVNLFFLISFYFLIKEKKVNWLRIIQNVIRVSFYGTVVTLVCFIIGAADFSTIDLVKSILGVFAYQYWFITVYVIICVFSPIFNSVINLLNRKYYLFVLIFLFYFSYIITFIFSGGLCGKLSFAIFIYFIIGYLEKYPDRNIFKKYRIVGTIVLFFGTLIGEIVISYLGTNYNATFFKIFFRLQDTQSPVMLLIALFTFYLFASVTWHNRFINFCGKYSAGAYLLHGGASFIKNILWDGLFKVGEFYVKSPIIYLLYYIGCVLLFLAIGILCEFIYSNTIAALINKWYFSSSLKEFFEKDFDIELNTKY